MAIRLRTINGTRIAVCAAETDELPDDVYLDDRDHYALAAKFARDNIGPIYDIEWSLMDTQINLDKVRERDEWFAKRAL